MTSGFNLPNQKSILGAKNVLSNETAVPYVALIHSKGMSLSAKYAMLKQIFLQKTYVENIFYHIITINYIKFEQSGHSVLDMRNLFRCL